MNAASRVSTHTRTPRRTHPLTSLRSWGPGVSRGTPFCGTRNLNVSFFTFFLVLGVDQRAFGRALRRARRVTARSTSFYGSQSRSRGTHVFVQFVHIWYIQDRFYASSPRVDNTPVHRSVLFCSFHESNHPTYAQHPKAHPGTAAQCRPWSSLPPSSSARSLPALARSPSSLPRSRHRRFRTGVGVLPHTPGMRGAPSTWVDLSKASPLDRMAFRIGVAGEDAPIVGAGTT